MRSGQRSRSSIPPCAPGAAGRAPGRGFGRGRPARAHGAQAGRRPGQPRERLQVPAGPGSGSGAGASRGEQPPGRHGLFSGLFPAVPGGTELPSGQPQGGPRSPREGGGWVRVGDVALSARSFTCGQQPWVTLRSSAAPPPRSLRASAAQCSLPSAPVRKVSGSILVLHLGELRDSNRAACSVQLPASSFLLSLYVFISSF